MNGHNLCITVQNPRGMFVLTDSGELQIHKIIQHRARSRQQIIYRQ